MKIKYIINEETNIKSFLLNNYYSLEVIYNLFHNKDLLKLNNQNLKFPFLLKENDILEVTLPSETSNQKIEEAKLDIIYEDDYILIVNKPKNLATIATSAHYNHNLGSQVLYYFSQNNIKSKVHFINRLDKETQGLVLIAKHQYIHNLFSKTVKITKKYKCLVSNIPKEKHATINLPIGKKGNEIKRFIDLKNGKESITEYELIATKNNQALLDVTLHTGRTHQIRLHMATIGCALVGDYLYNDVKDGDFFLQSYYLKFIHPITKNKIEIKI